MKIGKYPYEEEGRSSNTMSGRIIFPIYIFVFLLFSIGLRSSPSRPHSRRRQPTSPEQASRRATLSWALPTQTPSPSSKFLQKRNTFVNFIRFDFIFSISLVFPLIFFLRFSFGFCFSQKNSSLPLPFSLVFRFGF